MTGRKGRCEGGIPPPGDCNGGTLGPQVRANVAFDGTPASADGFRAAVAVG
jgi:hypothetical protein